MNVMELVVKGTDDIKIYVCGKCGTPWSAKAKDAKEIAEGCCKPAVCECGVTFDMKSCYSVCDECRAKKDAEKEAVLFEKAEKVTLKEYDGEFLYHDDFYNEGFVSADSVDSALEDFTKGKEPRYAWACNSHGTPCPDATDVMDHLLGDFHEDAIDSIDLDGLQKALDKWANDQPEALGYFPNFKKAVLLDDVLPEGRSKGEAQ